MNVREELHGFDDGCLWVSRRRSLEHPWECHRQPTGHPHGPPWYFMAKKLRRLSELSASFCQRTSTPNRQEDPKRPSKREKYRLSQPIIASFESGACPPLPPRHAMPGKNESGGKPKGHHHASIPPLQSYIEYRLSCEVYEKRGRLPQTPTINTNVIPEVDLRLCREQAWNRTPYLTK